MAQESFIIGLTGCLFTAASLVLASINIGTEQNLPFLIKTAVDFGSLVLPAYCIIAYTTSQITQDSAHENTPCSLHLKNMVTCLPPIFINIIRLMPLFFKYF